MTDAPKQTAVSEFELNTLPLSEELEVAPEFTFLELLTELARRKAIILRCTGAALLLGIILSFVLPVRYTASTKIMPPQQSPSTAMMMMNQLAASGSSSLAALAGGGAFGLRNPNDIYVGLLQSRPVADALIQKFDLARIYRAKDMTEARKKLSEFTQVSSEKSGFISVSVTDRDKQRAAGMSNEYVNQLRTLTKRIAVTEAGQRRLFYDDQIKSAKESLLLAQAEFQKVQQAKGIIQPEAQTRAMIENLARMRAEVAAKTVELQTLRTFSTDRNPQVQVAENELASLKDIVAHLEQNSQSAGFSELGMKDVPGAGMEYLAAQHEALYRQSLFDLLIKQYDAARLDEAKEAAVIQVVEPAIPPDRKSAPGRAVIVGVLSIAGFFGGCLLALLLWWKKLLEREPRLSGQLEDLKSALRIKRKAAAPKQFA